MLIISRMICISKDHAGDENTTFRYLIYISILDQLTAAHAGYIKVLDVVEKFNLTAFTITADCTISDEVLKFSVIITSRP